MSRRQKGMVLIFVIGILAIQTIMVVGGTQLAWLFDRQVDAVVDQMVQQRDTWLPP